MTTSDIEQLKSLIETMRHLRSEQGCEWDRQQTSESLRPYILEEAYELVDAIDAGDTSEILSELGDLLLQIIFQAQIYSEKGIFSIGDIAESINTKLLRRHPQVFSQDKRSIHPDWEQIKQQERIESGKATSLAERLPSNLPALKFADKVCRHLSAPEKSGSEPAAEKQGQQTAKGLDAEESHGQAIYTLVCQGLECGIDSESALRKFIGTLLRGESGR